eukprot:1190821-Prorocentrum_minimum.AAC.2
MRTRLLQQDEDPPAAAGTGASIPCGRRTPPPPSASGRPRPLLIGPRPAEPSADWSAPSIRSLWRGAGGASRRPAPSPRYLHHTSQQHSLGEWGSTRTFDVREELVGELNPLESDKMA